MRAGKVRPSSVYTLGAHARGERRQAGLAQYRCVDSKYSSLATTIAQPTDRQHSREGLDPANSSSSKKARACFSPGSSAISRRNDTHKLKEYGFFASMSLSVFAL